jgi:hypothetical protein
MGNMDYAATARQIWECWANNRGLRDPQLSQEPLLDTSQVLLGTAHFGGSRGERRDRLNSFCWCGPVFSARHLLRRRATQYNG